MTPGFVKATSAIVEARIISLFILGSKKLGRPLTAGSHYIRLPFSLIQDGQVDPVIATVMSLS